MKRIVFFHPDLGIGGAERLVVDAAVGLQSRGHKVTIFTSHCDRSHCFTEVKDGTLDVRVRGNTLVPPSIFGRFAIFCAVARQIHLVLAISVFSAELGDLGPTHFVVDQLSACVPLLRILFRDVGVLFYCHFPDKLLAQRASGVLGVIKSLYRIPFNALESWSTDCSDGVVVNSSFTGQTVKRVFPALGKRELRVVYPCVDTVLGKRARKASIWPDKKVILSINRFEKKKDAALALRAFAALSELERRDAILVIAGGYDPRLADNVTTLRSLQAMADGFKLSHVTVQDVKSTPTVDNDVSVLFLPSISESLKQSLLDSAILLVYTPCNEHFGIVPLEAMLNAVPVLAADQGGPVETVIDGTTGWLRNVADHGAWTAVFRDVLDKSGSSPGSLERMGRAGQEHVTEKFSKTTMAASLEACLDELQRSRRRPPVALVNVILPLLGLAAGVILYLFLR